MSGDGALRVHGGAGGTRARLDDLRSAASVLQSTAGRMRTLAATLLAVLAEPVLVGSALRSPRTFLAAEAALLSGAAGPHGLLPAAARLEGLGLAVEAAARAYTAADAAAGAAIRAVPWCAGYLAGSVASRLAVPVGQPVLGIVAVGATELRAIAGRSGAGTDAAGSTQSCRGLPAPLRSAGSAVLRVLAAHPGESQGLAAAVPGLLAGALGPQPGALWAAVAGGRWPPTGPADSAGLLGAAGGPWLDEPGQVRVAAVGAPVNVAPPPGVAGITADLADLERAPPGPVPPSGSARGCLPGAVAHPAARLRVERITGPDGRRSWLVEIPGIESWSPRAGPDPLDLTGAVHLLAGQQTAASHAVVAALRVAGARPGEPVMLAGHSEGGMVAAAVAADPSVRTAFHVTHVVALGAPISAARIPSGVQVLAVQHTGDLVPRVDGAADPDRPGWITVSRPWRDPSHPFAAHGITAYADTGALVDASTDPGLCVWRRGAAPFLTAPGGQVQAVDVVVVREGGGTADGGDAVFR